MNKCIAVFSNRTHTLIYYERLKNFGINCKIKNTPQGLGSVCGIVVEFDYKDIVRAKTLLSSLRLNSFKHIFLETEYGYKKL